MVAAYGYEIGRVVPLKFIGGSQRAVVAPDTAGVWTTSADKTNVYLGSSSMCIAIPSLDGKGTMLNVLGKNVMFDMEVCVKTKYPNPYSATFTEKAFTAPEAMISETIPSYTGCGELTDYDLDRKSTRLNSPDHLVCRLLLEKKNKKKKQKYKNI